MSAETEGKPSLHTTKLLFHHVRAEHSAQEEQEQPAVHSAIEDHSESEQEGKYEENDIIERKYIYNPAYVLVLNIREQNPK